MKCRICGCETEHFMCKSCYIREKVEADLEFFARMEAQELAEARERAEEEEENGKNES